GQGLVLEDDPEIRTVLLAEPIERRSEARAEWTLEIGEDDDRHVCEAIAAGRVVVRDRNGRIFLRGPRRSDGLRIFPAADDEIGRLRLARRSARASRDEE